ncbi:MAG: aspartate aminotransferase family protein [Gammaproteobacteria bacterium]|nr:aspartate aminotransferase family protein [Gammaproteobacteria bacterium]
MSTYSRLPVTFSRGEGATLWDTGGRAYLDGLGGIAVAILGHSHPEVAEVIAGQARTLIHTSNLYRVEEQEKLGDRLCGIAGMDQAFFGNSGAEANEAAIKLARRFGHGKGIASPSIIVADGAFHGRTMATLTATGNRRVQAGFEPLVPGFRRVPFNDLEAVRQVAQHDPDVVAVLVEPIQGEGGIRVPSPEYLPGLRDICRNHDWLLMLDEIQTGMGRTGEWFACRHQDVRPDVLTVAKALGNGIPIGACLASGQAAGVLSPGTHGSTFGGNPFACRVGLAVIDILDRTGSLENARRQGARILAGLDAGLGDHPGIRSMRGQGLMLGIEMTTPCGDIVSLALEEGLLVNVTAGNVIRLLPPLIYHDEDSDRLVELLVRTIKRFSRS